MNVTSIEKIAAALVLENSRLVDEAQKRPAKPEDRQLFYVCSEELDVKSVVRSAATEERSSN